MARKIALMFLLFATTGCNDKSGGLNVDCFPWPARVCGEECGNPCGGGCALCFPEGEVSCAYGKVTRCRRTCVEVLEVCSKADACALTTCAESVDDCDAVRDAYNAQLQIVPSASIAAVVREGDGGLPPGEYGYGCPNDCSVVPGDCAVGLETCWLVGWRTAEMDRLAALYERLGCSEKKECDCPPLDVTVTCQVSEAENETDAPSDVCVAE